MPGEGSGRGRKRKERERWSGWWMKGFINLVYSAISAFERLLVGFGSVIDSIVQSAIYLVYGCIALLAPQAASAE